MKLGWRVGSYSFFFVNPDVLIYWTMRPRAIWYHSYYLKDVYEVSVLGLGVRTLYFDWGAIGLLWMSTTPRPTLWHWVDDLSSPRQIAAAYCLRCARIWCEWTRTYVCMLHKDQDHSASLKLIVHTYGARAFRLIINIGCAEYARGIVN